MDGRWDGALSPPMARIVPESKGGASIVPTKGRFGWDYVDLSLNCLTRKPVTLLCGNSKLRTRDSPSQAKTIVGEKSPLHSQPLTKLACRTPLPRRAD
jgi:hypothetical protein